MISINVGEFPQRTRTFYGEKQGLKDVKILAISEAEGIIYVGCENGLLYQKGDEFKSVKLDSDCPVRMLFEMNGILYVGSGDTVYTVKGGKVTGKQKLDSTVKVGGQAVLGRQHIRTTPWLTERHGYDPT